MSITHLRFNFLPTGPRRPNCDDSQLLSSERTSTRSRLRQSRSVPRIDSDRDPGLDHLKSLLEKNSCFDYACLQDGLLIECPVPRLDRTNLTGVPAREIECLKTFATCSYDRFRIFFWWRSRRSRAETKKDTSFRHRRAEKSNSGTPLLHTFSLFSLESPPDRATDRPTGRPVWRPGWTADLRLLSTMSPGQEY